MLSFHRNRPATPTQQPAAPVTPNQGRFLPPPGFTQASDDVLVSHTGWAPWADSANHVAHRPDGDDMPACGAQHTDGWQRISAGHARTLMASPCPHRACGGGAVAGWATW